jgi:hypothetical protein
MILASMEGKLAALVATWSRRAFAAKIAPSQLVEPDRRREAGLQVNVIRGSQATSDRYID